jgi:Domain of unknown function (DUF397)
MVDWSDIAWRKSTHCSSNSCVEVGTFDSRIIMRNSQEDNGSVLAFSAAEWTEFLEGVRRGEFDISQ